MDLLVAFAPKGISLIRLVLSTGLVLKNWGLPQRKSPLRPEGIPLVTTGAGKLTIASLTGLQLPIALFLRYSIMPLLVSSATRTVPAGAEDRPPHYALAG